MVKSLIILITDRDWSSKMNTSLLGMNELVAARWFLDDEMKW